MSDYKFKMLDDHPGVIFVLSHSFEEVLAMGDAVKEEGGLVREAMAFMKENGITEIEDFNGFSYVPYNFNVNEDGAVVYAGPEADDPLYLKERFTKALEEFMKMRAMSLGMEQTDQPWINVGGTYCCGPSWEKNPCYEGEHGPSPEETVH